jgi:hypothetical protein
MLTAVAMLARASERSPSRTGTAWGGVQVAPEDAQLHLLARPAEDEHAGEERGTRAREAVDREDHRALDEASGCRGRLRHDGRDPRAGPGDVADDDAQVGVPDGAVLLEVVEHAPDHRPRDEMVGVRRGGARLRGAAPATGTMLQPMLSS